MQKPNTENAQERKNHAKRDSAQTIVYYTLAANLRADGPPYARSYIFLLIDGCLLSRVCACAVVSNLYGFAINYSVPALTRVCNRSARGRVYTYSRELRVCTHSAQTETLVFTCNVCCATPCNALACSITSMRTSALVCVLARVSYTYNN